MGSFAETRSSISSAFKTWASLVRMTRQFCNGPPTRGASSSLTTFQHWRSTRWLELPAGQPMPRVLEVSSVAPIGQAIDDLILLAECSFEGEWEGQVRFLPL